MGPPLRFTYLDVPERKWMDQRFQINGLFHLLINGVYVYIQIFIYWGYNQQGYSKRWALEKVTPFKQISGSLKTI